MSLSKKIILSIISIPVTTFLWLLLLVQAGFSYGFWLIPIGIAIPFLAPFLIDTVKRDRPMRYGPASVLVYTLLIFLALTQLLFILSSDPLLFIYFITSIFALWLVIPFTIAVVTGLCMGYIALHGLRTKTPVTQLPRKMQQAASISFMLTICLFVARFLGFVQ